jgi:hypothetical protein
VVPELESTVYIYSCPEPGGEDKSPRSKSSGQVDEFIFGRCIPEGLSAPKGFTVGSDRPPVAN